MEKVTSTCRKPRLGTDGGMAGGQTTGEASEASCSLATDGSKKEETGFFQKVPGHSQAMPKNLGLVCAKDLEEEASHVCQFYV